MARLNALIFLAFVFGLLTVSMGKAHSRAQAPIAAAPKASPSESSAAPKASSDESSAAPKASSEEATAAPKKSPTGSHAADTPVSAPSHAAKAPSSDSTLKAKTPASGPGTAFPPSSGASATATLDKIMVILGATLVGGAAFLL